METAAGSLAFFRVLCTSLLKLDAEDYYDGAIDALVNPATAAIGKLNVETADLRLGGVLLDWIAELRDMCVKSEEPFSRARRRRASSSPCCLWAAAAWLISSGVSNSPNLSYMVGSFLSLMLNY